MSDYRCTHGHDLCHKTLPSSVCPYCEPIGVKEVTVEVTEVITYSVTVEAGPDDDPEEMAIVAVVASESPWEEYGKEINERYAEEV